MCVGTAVGETVGDDARECVCVGAGVFVGASEDAGTVANVAEGTFVSVAEGSVFSGVLDRASGSAGSGLTSVTKPQAAKMASTRINMVRSLLVTRYR